MGSRSAELLRPGRAGSNTAADHVTVLDAALAQLPAALRGPRRATAGCRCWCAPTPPAPPRSSPATSPRPGCEFSVGANLGHFDIHTALAHLPAAGVDPGLSGPQAPRRRDTGCRSNPATAPGSPRPPGWSTCPRWPPGTRLILRKERPHPGAQLRTTDADGLRITGFLTNTTHGGPGRQLADLELRHRRHARVEDRIRAAKDTGMRNLPFHDTEPEPDLARHRRPGRGPAGLVPPGSRCPPPPRAYEPKRLRLRILAVAGRIVRTARRRVLHIDPAWPWADTITTAHARLCALPVP